MVGDIKENRTGRWSGNGSGGNLYALATLDGLLMLIKRETIIW